MRPTQCVLSALSLFVLCLAATLAVYEANPWSGNSASTAPQLASRYPLRSRTPGFYERAKGPTSAPSAHTGTRR